MALFLLTVAIGLLVISAVHLHIAYDLRQLERRWRQRRWQRETETLMGRWRPPETAPKNGKAFLITTAGPQIDMCWWDSVTEEFRDYSFKQAIKQEWPYMVGWRPLPRAARVENTVEQSREANGWPT
jgi:hypothetical protein